MVALRYEVDRVMNAKENSQEASNGTQARIFSTRPNRELSMIPIAIACFKIKYYMHSPGLVFRDDQHLFALSHARLQFSLLKAHIERRCSNLHSCGTIHGYISLF